MMNPALFRTFWVEHPPRVPCAYHRGAFRGEWRARFVRVFRNDRRVLVTIRRWYGCRHHFYPSFIDEPVTEK